MTNKELGALINQLDSNRFGFPVARINNWIENRPIETCLILRKYGVKLVISKVPSKYSDTIQSLLEFGFEKMDTVIHYKRTFPDSELSNSFSNTKFKYRQAEIEDIPQLVKIARSSFLGGHYFADSRLDQQKCKEIYQDWIRRSCLGQTGDKVYIAHLNNDIAGFATFEKHGNETLWAGIGATGEQFRNQGACRSTLQFGINEYIGEHQFQYFGSAVSESNRSVNKVFSDLGCEPEEKFFILHGWLD
ncbi:MAG: hypothetical protein HWE07_10900 [Cytophagia bacterium]|nr:hypothetical protein [Cytophagia bacterium]